MKIEIVSFGAMATVVAPPKIIQNLKNNLTLKINNRGKIFTGKDNLKFLFLFRERRADTIDVPIGIIPENRIPQEFFEQNWERIDIKFIGELRPTQKMLVDNFLGQLKIGGILSAKTGTGKSVMAANMVCKLGYKTLVVVPLTSLVEQWIKILTTFTTLKRDEIGIIQADKCIVKGKKIVIGMLHTLSKEKFDIENEFGVVVYDEVHKLGAETFSVVAMQFNCRYRIGLSATPRRKDGTDKVFLWNIGKVLTKDENLDVVPKVAMIYWNHVDGRGVYNQWDGQFNFGKYLTRISISEERNKLILNLILKFYKEGRNILVLCDRIEHVTQLHNFLKKEGVDVGMFTSHIKERSKKVIIATHGSCGIGVDIPRLDTLIFATPRSDIEQPVGRILRKCENKKQPLVVDIVDNACKEMKAWSEKRKKFYNKIGAIITTKTV